MKQCKSCHVEKDESEFYRSGRGSKYVASVCKACANEYSQGRYEAKKGIPESIECVDCHKTALRANPTAACCHECWLIRQKRSRDAAKERNRVIIEQAKSIPCTDCRGTFPTICMDFDHLPGSGKLYDVGDLAIARAASVERLMTEISKCEVVCSNCHRIRTLARRS